MKPYPDPEGKWGQLTQYGCRIINSLRNGGYHSLEEIKHLSDSQLLNCYNLGKISLKQIREIIPYQESVQLRYYLSSNDKELLYLYLQSSMYRQPDNEIPLDALLSRIGFANLTVCPRCGVDDFVHVEGCEFIPDI